MDEQGLTMHLRGHLMVLFGFGRRPREETDGVQFLGTFSLRFLNWPPFDAFLYRSCQAV